MNRNIINQMDSNTRAKYDSFEKAAARSPQNMKPKFFFTVFGLTFLFSYFVSDRFFGRVFDADALSVIIIAIVIDLVICVLTLYAVQGGAVGLKILKLERTEGPSDNLIAYLYQLCGNPKNDKAKKQLYQTYIAFYHNDRGEYDLAIKVLSDIHPDQYIHEPANTQLYFGAMLEAYSAKGDRENAAKIYADGSYYITTYMNFAPARMRQPLANYEYLMGNYKMSITLLEVALQLEYENINPKEQILAEIITTQIVYRIALSYAALGEIQNALNALKQTEGKTCTPYFRTCIEKLQTDLTNNINTTL